MSQPAFNFEEFIEKPTENETVPIEKEQESEETVTDTETLDVQKAVVESLAADKIEQTEKILQLEKEIAELKSQLNEKTNELLIVSQKLTNQSEALEKVADTLSANVESKESNQVALLDREMELPDRFPGETRDHVIEAIKVARDQAESDGRNRCAQVLEAVLVANEPLGNLNKRRHELQKLFNENQNVINGIVIAKLQEMGISHKNGEEYLLGSEIIKRNY